MRIELHNIKKSYGDKPVLTGVDAVFKDGGAYLLTGPSGVGKTTLLRIMLGLEKPDGGAVFYFADAKHDANKNSNKAENKTGCKNAEHEAGGPVSSQGACDDMPMDGGSGHSDGTIIHPELPLHAGVVFQEDRLCEGFSAVENVAMIFKTPDRDMIRRELGRLLPADELDKPVSELSGGMRRRVCIVRACMAEVELLVMDEPFNGLDDETRDKCINYIRDMQQGRTLVIVSHLTEGLDFCENLTVSGHTYL